MSHPKLTVQSPGPERVTADIASLYQAAEDALPDGWRLNGLHCASTGLAIAQRLERWVAEACGSGDTCLRLERQTPEDALRALIAQLRGSTG